VKLGKGKSRNIEIEQSNLVIVVVALILDGNLHLRVKKPERIVNVLTKAAAIVLSGRVIVLKGLNHESGSIELCH